jgi:hypothetical protein
MRKILALMITCLFVFPLREVKSQVAINADGSAPDPSAMLDVVSTSKGLLIPRVTATSSVSGPAVGLLVYQTGSPAGFYYYNGTSWVLISSGSYTETDPVVRAIVGIVKSNGTTISAAVPGTDYAPATSGTSILKGNGSGGFSSAVAETDYEAALGNPSVNGYVLSSTTTGTRSWIATGGGVTSVTGTAPVVSSGGTTPAISMHVADKTDNGYLSSADWNTFMNTSNGNQWSFSDPNMYYTAGSIGIGTASPNSSAILDLTSTSKGLLLPRLATRSISSPAFGLLIYNSTSSGGGLSFYNGSWLTLATLNGSNLLPVASGGTGASSLTAYMPVCGGTTTTGAVQSVATGTKYYPLCFNSSNSLPSFQLLQVAGGGTGQSSALVAGGVLYGSTSTAMGVTAAGTVAGQVLQSNVAGAPTFSTATYPATAGTAGNVMMSNGTNWASTSASGILVDVKILTASGNYTPTSGVTKVFIRMVGGGGAGGGVNATSSGAGGGGGAGGYTEKLIAVTNTSYSYTIGTAGAGNSGAAGGNGGATSITIGSAITANGGTGGSYTAGSETNKFAAGGAGGTAGSGGDLMVAGQPGEAGMTFSSATLASSGNGGSSPFGGGGKGRVNATAAGIAGTGYGAGGGGACAIANTANAGGAGTAGVIIIWEYK